MEGPRESRRTHVALWIEQECATCEGGSRAEAHQHDGAFVRWERSRWQAEPVEGSGALTTYLVTAPGVGKTYAMLQAGRLRSGAGQRVVVGWLERHDRAETRAQVGDLEVLPPRPVSYQSGTFVEFDVEAVMASGASVALVDELAHTVVGTTRRRWQEVADILAAGVDVMTTANLANLESARDYVARLTGAGTVESIPDEFVRSGETVLVDLPAYALRRRIADGKVYSADRVGGALADYFRVSNLQALSALGRAWMDGTLEAAAEELLAARGYVLASRPTVVAGVSDTGWGQHVIRHATERALEDDADLLVVHVILDDGMTDRRSEAHTEHRDLATEAGGFYIELTAESVPEGLARAVRDHGASRLVVGRHRSRLGEIVHGSIVSRLQRLLPEVRIEAVREETVSPNANA
jgi:two-component system sensor histidine kinase KdpD